MFQESGKLRKQREGRIVGTTIFGVLQSMGSQGVGHELVIKQH